MENKNIDNGKSNAVVRVVNVVKRYGDVRNSFTALDKINLEINEGDFVGIMGPSGSEKTTLLNLIATVDIPTTGNVYINDKRVVTMSGGELSKFRRENVGFIFQDCNLLDTLTLRDNILAPLILAGIDREECNKRLLSVAKRMEIEAILDKYPAECSGGQKQRAATCRALAGNPKIIVVDEPTAALDTKNSVELLSMLKKLNERDGITIIMVTHDPLIASYCSKVVLIRDGKLDVSIEREKKEQMDFYESILDETAKESEMIFESGENKKNHRAKGTSESKSKEINDIDVNKVYGLGKKDSDELLETINKLNKSNGVNVVIVTKDPKVASHCEKIILAKDNEVAAELDKKNMDEEEFYSKIIIEEFN